jgi:hypothetical protein
MRSILRHSIRFIVFFVLFLQFGCAGLSHNNNSSEELRSRATGFLQAMVDKKWAAAYVYFESSYKKRVSPELFSVLPRKVELKAFSIKEIKVSDTARQAEITILEDIAVPQGFTFPGMKKVQSWIIEKGEWVLVEPPPAVAAPTKPS